MSARGLSLALLRVLLWGLTAALVLALGLGATARGTALLARTLSLVEPRLVLAHRDGNLLEAGFERIAWHDAGLAVELRDIAWTLSPRCLLTDTLCFEQLTIATLDIDIGPPSGKSSPLALAPVMLPLPLSVAHGTLATLGVRRGAETLLTLQDIALGGELQGRAEGAVQRGGAAHGAAQRRCPAGGTEVRGPRLHGPAPPGASSDAT